MTAYSGLWNNEYGENYSLLRGETENVATSIARRLRPIYGASRVRGLLTALVQGGAGEQATAVHKRVKAVRDLAGNAQGGDRVIETYIAVDRLTTAEDIDDFTEKLNIVAHPAPYPRDRSGNGGGSKRGW